MISIHNIDSKNKQVNAPAEGNSYRLLWAEKGAGELFTGGRSISIGPGTVIFFKPFQTFAQPLAQFGEPLGSKQQKCHHGQNNQVPWL